MRKIFVLCITTFLLIPLCLFLFSPEPAALRAVEHLILIIPDGIINAGMMFTALILTAAVFIIVLRRQVLRATKNLLEHQARLRESEARLIQAQAIAHVGNWELNLSSNTMWASIEAFRLYGLERPSPYLSLAQAQSIPLQEERPRLDAALSALLNLEVPYDLEFRIQRANDKAIRVIHTIAHLVRDPNGVPSQIVGVFQDITDRKNGEEQLRETRQLLKRVLDATPQCISWKDRDLRFLGCNQNFARLAGLSKPDEIRGKTESDLPWPMEKIEYTINMERHLIETDKSEMGILEQSIGNDGSVDWLETTKIPLHDTQGNVDGILVVRDNVTERKQAEEALRESEMFLHQTETIARVGGWRANPETDFLLFTNGIHHILELPYKQNLGLADGLTFFLPQYIPILRNRLLNTLDTGAPFVEECEVLTASGKHLWVEVRGLTSVCINKITYVIGTFQDITDHKKADKEKSKLEQQFQQAQKMESVGRLASGVAHDLNNLLTPILGFGEIMCDGFFADDPRKDIMEQIIEAGERARDLVRRLLAFSRKQVLEFKPLDLNILLNGFEKLLRHTIREDIIIKYKSEPGIPCFKGDIGQVEQVLMNLAVNAQDAMPEGGMLTIETSIAELDESYAMLHPSVIPGQYLLLAISDTGQGMSEEVKAHLFEPFFTTKEKGKGTGLGLATTYGIIKQHGGNIWVYSELGQGTTFKIYLPVVDATVNPKEETQKLSGKEDVGGNETILLAEDDEMVRGLAKAILVQRGYKMLCAANGNEAMAILTENEGPVHLLLTDLVMPEMNGKQLFVKALKHHQSLKALFMSGYSEDAISLPADQKINFIQKPFSIQGLAAKVREVLDGFVKEENSN